MRENFLVFGAPAIGEPEIEEMIQVLRSGWLGTGARTARFEREFAAYTSAEHAVAVSSCTAALHLSMVAAGIGPGDEVITTPLTFCATVNAIIHTGATPVLADVDRATLNVDPEEVRAKITPRTRAILPVHFAGNPCDMDALGAIAADQGLFLIEDCAHAIESRWQGRNAGTFGRFGCFSFYATKNLCTGEGGMVTAAEAADAASVRRLSLHGMSKDAWNRFGGDGYRHYDVTEVGFKYNMTDMQAALGIHQLARLEENLARREALWARYNGALADLPLDLPPETMEPGSRHARHLYTVLVRPGASLGRDSLLEGLTDRRIGTGVHYRSVADYQLYQDRFGWAPDDFPVATDIGRRILSLPLTAGMDDADADDVIEALGSLLGSN